MKISILTLFPEMFDNFKTSSIIKRAIDKSLVDIEIINIRDFSKLNNKQVDDTPYGGGCGMVLMAQPIYPLRYIYKEMKSIAGSPCYQKFLKLPPDFLHPSILFLVYARFVSPCLDQAVLLTI